MRRRSHVACGVAVLGAALCESAVGQSLHPKPSEVEWTQPSSPAEAHQQRPLGSPAECDRRYKRAWELIRANDYDGALEEFVWLWYATDNKVSAFEPAIRTPIIQSIGRLAPYHQPTNLKFTAVLDELEQYVRSHEKAYREWTDWADLSRAMGQEERLIRLYEERREPDGSIKGFDIHPYALDDVIEVLLERGRFADVGRIEADIVGQAQLDLAMTDMMAVESPDVFSKADLEQSRHDDRQKVALLYAVGLAAGRTAESQQIAALLLAKYDSVDSRRELVLACLRVGVTPDTVPRWIGELKERGEDVADLTSALADAKSK